MLYNDCILCVHDKNDTKCFGSIHDLEVKGQGKIYIKDRQYGL